MLNGVDVVKHTIIAIAGASASGKSLFTSTVYQELVSELGSDCIAILSEDAYYRDQQHLSLQQRLLTNYDHPNAFEHQLLVNHLLALRKGNAIQMPQYSYTQHTRTTETVLVQPAKVILVEGILLLTDKSLRQLFDITVFIDTPLDVCLMRRMQRDIEQRGRSISSVVEQYTNTVRPAFFEFIEPTKQHADLVVTRGGKNQIAIDIIKTKIRQLLVEK